MDTFSELYNRYAKRVYQYLLSLTKDSAYAEELTQETFYRAFRHLGKFRGESSLYTWLCRIGKNLFLSEQRKHRRIVQPDPTHPLAEGEEPFPMEMLLDKQTVLSVHKALHTLEEPYREVFSLRIFGELKFREIAEIFGKTENWAKVTFFRAKERIIKEMEARGWI